MQISKSNRFPKLHDSVPAVHVGLMRVALFVAGWFTGTVMCAAVALGWWL